MTHSVCIVGAGVGAAHLEGFAKLPDLFTIHSICDLDVKRGQELADTHPGCGFTTDLAAVLTNPDIDIVDICLPPHLHLQACMDALEAGKKIICEKPLVSSLAEADALLAKVVETNGFISPVFQYRFGLGTAQLQSLMDAGLAGRAYVGTLETHWNRPASYYDVAWRGTWTGERGGALLGHAIHIHDLLPSLLGPVASVYADTATRVNNIEVEDCAALTIRMQSGALITSSVTLGCAENISRMRLMFEGFTVESDHSPYALATNAWRFVARAPTTQTQIDAALAAVAPPHVGYAGMFNAISDTLTGQDDRHVTLADGRRSLEFVTAVYASAGTGQVQILPLSSDHPMYHGWMPKANLGDH